MVSADANHFASAETTGATLSVLMPVYNRKAYASVAVDSVLSQTHRDFEFIIINDGSTDGVTELLREYAKRDSRIVLIEQENTGYSRALNRGLQAARGELIARMDSDDVCLPRRFERQLSFLCEHPEVVAVGGQVTMIDEDGDELAPLPHMTDSKRIEQRLLGMIESNEGVLTHPAVMMRREAVTSVGGYRPEFEPAEDRDLWLRLSELGALANVDETILLYRSHTGCVSKTRAKQQHTNAVRAIHEAYTRRGLELPETLHMWQLSDRAKSDSVVRAGHALSAACHGNHRTARKLAMRALRTNPFYGPAWKALAMGLLGTQSTQRVIRMKRWLSNSS